MWIVDSMDYGSDVPLYWPVWILIRWILNFTVPPDWRCFWPGPVLRRCHFTNGRARPAGGRNQSEQPEQSGKFRAKLIREILGDVRLPARTSLRLLHALTLPQVQLGRRGGVCPAVRLERPLPQPRTGSHNAGVTQGGSHEGYMVHNTQRRLRPYTGREYPLC